MLCFDFLNGELDLFFSVFRVITHKTQNMCIPETEHSQVSLKYNTPQTQATPNAEDEGRGAGKVWGWLGACLHLDSAPRPSPP